MLWKIAARVGEISKNAYLIRSLIALLLLKSGAYKGIRLLDRTRSTNIPRADLHDLNRSMSVDVIPDIVFQTWKSRTDFPSNYDYWRSTLFKLNPTWRFVVWDDDDNRGFVESVFPWFLSAYNNMPAEIYRADAIRPLFLLYFGGVYVDMDVEAINPITLDGDVVLGAMGSDLSFAHSIPNAIMVSKPRQLFWMLFVHLMYRKALECEASGAYPDPEFVTGPQILKMSYEIYQSLSHDQLLEFIEPTLGLIGDDLRQSLRYGAVTLLDKRHFFPINWDNPIQRRLRAELMRRKIVLGGTVARFISPNSTFTTYWTHSW